MKQKHTHFAFFILLIFSLFLGFDSINTCMKQCGRIGLTRKNGDGCTCHNVGVPSPNVFVQISGPDSLAAGATAEYMAVLFGGPDSAGGVNVAARMGILHSIDSTFCEIDSEITYNSPHVRPVDGAMVWHFNYTAPVQLGYDTIYCVGNSVNLSGTPEGDQWNFAPNFPVKIVGATGVTEINNNSPAKVELFQNYPNPFNPSTVIGFSLPSVSTVSLKVYNTLGEEVAILINSERMDVGTHSVVWRAGGVTSGVYFVRLATGDETVTRKIVLEK